MERGEECLSALALDQLLAHELPRQREANVQAHLVACERCKQRLELVRADALRFADEAPARGEVAAAQPSTAAWRWLTPAASVLAAAAALVLWLQGNPTLQAPMAPASSGSRAGAHSSQLRPRGDDPQASPASPTTAAAAPNAGGSAPTTTPSPTTSSNRTKGTGPTLRFFVRRSDRVLDGEPSMQLFAGDELRFALGLDRTAHCGVWGREANGRLSPYVVAESLVRLEPGQGQLLDGATRLDQSLGTESLIAVCCEKATRAESVTLALQSGSLGELPSNCSQTQLSVQKVSLP